MATNLARGAGMILLLLAGCAEHDDATPLPLTSVTVPIGFPPAGLSATAPADNALTEARAQLGKRLFFDGRLSRTGLVSCGSCHLQHHAFADPGAVSTGVDGRQGKRNAPALVNLAWSETFFWDGRVTTLEEQAGKPIEDPSEMDLPLPLAVERLRADPAAVRAFGDAYAAPPDEALLRKALATFVRTLVSAGSPYDRYLAGDDRVFGERQRRGEALFFSERAGCFHCHPAGRLTNEGFFNNGTFVAGGDTGRQALTGRTGDLGKFKVPGLRNIAATAPYMHDGSLPTLEAVVDHYNRGGNGHASTDPQVEPLGLSADERADLVAFLRSLTDPLFLGDPRFQPSRRVGE